MALLRSLAPPSLSSPHRRHFKSSLTNLYIKARRVPLGNNLDNNGSENKFGLCKPRPVLIRWAFVDPIRTSRSIPFVIILLWDISNSLTEGVKLPKSFYSQRSLGLEGLTGTRWNLPVDPTALLGVPTNL